jgi:uncharacterized membrane protein
LGRSREVRDLRRYVRTVHRGLEREIETRAALTEAEIDRRTTAIQREAEQATADLAAQLAVMNEFRGAMADQFARAVTRADFDAIITAVTERFTAAAETLAARTDKIEKTLDTQRGRQYAYAAIAAVLGVLLTIAILVAGHISVK